MTFNEGMQIDTSTTSTSGGGRVIAVGGGLAGLVVVLLALFLGVDPGGVTGQQPVNTREDAAPGFDLNKCRTGADANKYVQCRVVATANSVDAVWKQLMPGYTRPHVRLFSGRVDTGCGPATSAVGPFYCPVDKTAYFDTDFFQVLQDQFGSSGGPLAQEYVVAHEYGHHVQDLLAIRGDQKTILKMEKILMKEIAAYIESHDAQRHDYSKPVRLEGIRAEEKKPLKVKAKIAARGKK